MEINLMSQEIAGKTWGVGRCVVHLGGLPVDCIAVSCGDDQRITNADHAIEWLVAHGFPADRAGDFLTTGLQAWDESHSIGIA